MKYQNPVLRGMYPDPSVCKAGDKFYLVCSTFQYFPGVPVFESEDLVNWTQVGNCLTRDSQLPLKEADTGSGIYAPTIRYNNGRFYMVTTNVSWDHNFYVWTDDIRGEWSDPVFVEQDGIDPSLYFEEEKAYFVSNGNDDEGRPCVRICQIDIETGKKITETQPLWYGAGGRFLEAPHLYKFGDYYYILNAEGGTEYGHMVNYARSKSIFGPYENYPGNPVLTNRNLGGYILQGAGHGDIVQDNKGNWWFVHLAFRQTGMWMPYHHLGRETCLVPVSYENGWFTMGDGGVSRLSFDLPERDGVEQELDFCKTFENTTVNFDWVFLRNYIRENYDLKKECFRLKGTKDTLFEKQLPTAVCLRQSEMTEDIAVTVKRGGLTEAGISMNMDTRHHYDLFVNAKGNAVLRLHIGPALAVVKELPTAGDEVRLIVEAKPEHYYFYALVKGEKVYLGEADTRYLSSEVAAGFTGTMITLYAVDEDGKWAEFTDFAAVHKED